MTDRGKLVVGIDGSPSAQRALAWTLEEARLRDAEVDVVTVYQPISYAAAPLYQYPETAERLEEELHARAIRVLDDALRTVDDARAHRAVVKSMQISDALVARSREADLLVVGSRGLGGFKGLLLGSVSQQCIQHATCPVVVVRPATHGPETAAEPAA